MALILPVNGIEPTFGDNNYIAENATVVGDVVKLMVGNVLVAFIKASVPILAFGWLGVKYVNPLVWETLFVLVMLNE